jgi:hypothetical protein
MRNAADILGVPVDRVTMEEALDKIKGFLSDSTTNAIYTPNSEIMMAAQRDAGLKRILCEGSLVVADGAGVVLASKILKQELPEKVSGFDLTLKTFEMAKKRKISFFLFGGKPGTAEDAAKRIITDYPGVEIAGYRNGYFTTLLLSLLYFDLFTVFSSLRLIFGVSLFPTVSNLLLYRQILFEHKLVFLQTVKSCAACFAVAAIQALHKLKMSLRSN